MTFSPRAVFALTRHHSRYHRRRPAGTIGRRLAAEGHDYVFGPRRWKNFAGKIFFLCFSAKPVYSVAHRSADHLIRSIYLRGCYEAF